MSTNHTLSRLRESFVQDDESILTTEQVELREQLLHTFSLLMGGEHTTRSCVDEIMRTYGIKSITTAYARIRDAKALFGDVTTGHRMADSLILWQRAEKNWEDTAKIADVADRVEKRDKVLQTMMKIRGAGGAEEGVVDPSKYEPHTYQIRLSKPVKRLLFNLLKSGAVDLDEDMPEMITEAVVVQPAPAPVPAQ